MFIRLKEFRSSHPNFAPPLRHNGEPMDLFSVELSGNFLVARYLNTVPLEGPSAERQVVDTYLNNDGLEVFRVTAQIVEPPPPPPTFRERLGMAWSLVRGS